MPNSHKRILLAEDEPGLLMSLADRLGHEGYDVETAEDGETALKRASREPFDLMVLDIMLPKRSGFEVLRELRRRGAELAILVLTARGQLLDRVLGFKLGADDYLTKPFEVEELLARIEARLRRSGDGPLAGPPDAYRFGNVRVDFRKTEVERDGEQVELSAMELMLLRYFVAHRGQTVSRDELLKAVWGYDNPPSTRTVDVHVASLRRKLERNPRYPEYILTIHRLGYKFVG
jgi:two-component system alkaline phosphatase synthesis response regulator PhoP